jgi:hypothetical protein
MGALSELIFGGDSYRDLPTGWKDVTPEPPTLELGMNDVDFSNKNLGVGGAVIISAWMSLRDKWTLMALGISNNDIGELVQPPALGWTRDGVDDG